MRIVIATMKSGVSQIEVKSYQVEGNCQNDVMGMELFVKTQCDRFEMCMLSTRDCDFL